MGLFYSFIQTFIGEETQCTQMQFYVIMVELMYVHDTGQQCLLAVLMQYTHLPVH